MRLPSTRFVTRLAPCAILVVAVLAFAPPAQSQEYSLFDKFSIGFGASALSFDTEIRLDSTNLGVGTGIDYEDTLGVSSDEFTPSLVFEWRVGRRHNIFGRWDAVERDGTEVVSTELQFGDLVIPVDAAATTQFDLDELLFGYTYYPWLRDRWALGVGLGFRWLDITTSIDVTALGGLPVNIGLRESADVSAPLPFLNIDYRYGISEYWRFGAGFGFLDLEIGDLKGSQTVIGATVDHIAWDRFGWGFFGNFGAIDVDITATDYVGSAKVDILRGGVFAKARW